MSLAPTRPETPEETAFRLARVPRTARRVHLVAVAGTGMGSLAGMFAAAGFEVTGSDQAVYPPMSVQLERWGIRVMQGYRAENLAHRPDLVVVGNAMSRGNPEVEALLESGLPYVSMPEALRLFFLRDKHSVVIAGTHGKTTTTALAGSVLLSAGRDPSLLVGGVAKDFEGGFRLGKGNHFVIEGDEYDTAFFDKGPKFLHYEPKSVILTSVEFDHADIYRDLDHVREAFRRFVALIPAMGILAVCGDDEEALAVALTGRCRVLRYGLGDNADLRGKVLGVDREATRFEATLRREPLGTFRIPLPGAHNVCNALGVIGVCLDLGLAPEEVRGGLARFGGVARRQEERGEAAGILVIDDFAHHPTAVAATLAALRALGGEGRLVAVFEPRSYTAKTRALQAEFARAFGGADRVIIAAAHLPGKVPEGLRLSETDLVAGIRRGGTDAAFIPTVDEIVRTVAAEARPGDRVAILSNGGFGGIHDKLLRALEAAAHR